MCHILFLYVDRCDIQMTEIEQMKTAYYHLIKLNVFNDSPIENNVMSLTKEFDDFRLSVGKEPEKMGIILYSVNNIPEKIFQNEKEDFIYKMSMSFLMRFFVETKKLDEFMSIPEAEQTAIIALMSAFVTEMYKQLEKETTYSYIS
jgi:hypothetical protein